MNIRPKIAVTRDGFSITRMGKVAAIRLSQITRISAYKLDEVTTDLVCLDIVYSQGGQELMRTIHEDLAGFDALVSRLANLPGITPDWQEAVMHPPFAAQRTTIYDCTPANG